MKTDWKYTPNNGKPMTVGGLKEFLKTFSDDCTILTLDPNTGGYEPIKGATFNKDTNTVELWSDR